MEQLHVPDHPLHVSISYLTIFEEPEGHLPAQISLGSHLQQGMCCKELRLSTDTELSFVSLPLVS